jgi:hypothetical protein
MGGRGIDAYGARPWGERRPPHGDGRQRRFATLALLAVWLMVGGIFARVSGEPWVSVRAPVFLAGLGVLLFAFVVGRPFSDQDAAKPAT